MKRRVSILNALLMSASSLGLSLAPLAALATPVVEVNLNTSADVTGSYLTTPLGKPNPAVYQVYAGANECLRIVGTAQTVDVEATLISPNGTVWRNDDGVPGTTLPLIKAVTSGAGWYTLQISHYSGSGSNGTFTVNVGRYATTNSLCSPSTPPVAASPNTPK